ncbi:MAG: hypothetical protein DCF19_11735 [Pseudanabaena frigida]|uniref:NACHT domain-containing protein n=1 Tax=Pseudanabaena frigida TaxID=945775 RepID=A0A2W4W7Z9_9CYAN|nr:MAG: hypothetical protein DCF19_11735 [Pseudanabaena frigida]
MQPFEFESMAQALLEQTYRIGGNLVQFGAGKDGGREATWSQPNTHPDYSRPINQQEDVVKEWVFQVKYHDKDQRGWSIARDAVIDDLDKELDKIINKHKVPCHAYVMITNVPFTGARNVGTRDKATIIVGKWKKDIPEIYVWDAADLSRMLDANEDVRTAYIDTILVGDTLKALYSEGIYKLDLKQSEFKAYLNFITEREESARAEEAGDDPNLSLAEVFIDLTLKIRDNNEKDFIKCLTRENKFKANSSLALLPEDLTKVRASFALFFGDHSHTLLLGGPGLGKSTLTQFLSLYQAARIVKTDLCLRLIERLKLPEGITTKDLDSYCRPRFPFRIELRRYAKWMSDQHNNRHELARYIVDGLINPNASSALEMEDVFGLAAKNPILLILDGLDEVPNSETRRKIIENLTVFLRRITSDNGDIQVILSSRPKGYSSEFEEFKPITWELNELERIDFNEYCECWLKNRIRDVDERNEAQERINRGMMSEAVQRLARSLLQATVILTIVRRKIEIPHQRNSLYKKYVEVIFDREKEKSPIVRERETELLRLHERVGYELHCKMEKKKIESLDRDTFRGYVLNVLEDYSASKLGDKTFRDIADEIIEAATDRLCLLVGKGEDQTDVDFVVQQYREYFAAVYLSNHPDADPENVFNMLVRRGAYWAYVLQFYVAQANTNQQMRWVTSITDQEEEEEHVEAFIRKTRTHRAILNVLPEFTLQRKIDFERTLKMIFSLETRWTYLNQESAIGILNLIPSIDVFQTFWELFRDLSLDDKATLAVELWLLAELVSPQSEYYDNLCAKVQNLLLEENTQSTALLSTFQNDLKVDLTVCDISKLKIAFENYFYREISKQSYDRQNQFNNLIYYQTKEKQCEILLSIGNRWYWSNVSFPVLSPALEKNVFPEVEFSILRDSLKLRLLPYLCRRLDKLKSLKKWSKGLDEIEGLNARYLNTLIQAIQDPTNNDLDNEARVLENQLASNLSYTWKSEYVLGPPVSSFSSIETWKDFKQKLSDISTNDPKWIAKNIDFNDSQGLGICLFFHPDHWSLLVEENLITAKDLEELTNTPLGNILKIPRLPLDIFHDISFFSDAHPAIPIHKVLRVVLNILEREGIDRVSKAKGLDGLLYRRRMQSISIEEIENLLNQAKNLPSLPSIWISVILRLCLNTLELNIELLLDFWGKFEHLKLHFSLIHEEELPKSWNHLLEKLLASNRASALRLTMTIAACSQLNIKIQDSLRERLLAESDNYLNSDDTSYELYYAVLLNLEPSLEEFSLWVKPECIHRLEKSSWLLERLSKRFLSASDPKSKIDYDQLRSLLSLFIAKRCDYPPTIALGALEAILKIDENNLPTLVDKMWKQCPDG